MRITVLLVVMLATGVACLVGLPGAMDFRYGRCNLSGEGILAEEELKNPSPPGAVSRWMDRHTGWVMLALLSIVIILGAFLLWDVLRGDSPRRWRRRCRLTTQQRSGGSIRR
jgi:hypothetical protein